MKKAVLLLLVFVVAMSCVFAANLIPRTLLEKFSYVLGYCVGSYYYPMYKYYYYPEALDEYCELGAQHLTAGAGLFTETEMQKIIQDYEADYAARMTALAEANLKAAEAFLEENKTKEGIKVTSSGLQYKVIKEGTGAKPKDTSTVEVDYKLTLLDGTVADSSYARGEHSSFPISGVVKGFAEGCKLMSVGSHYIIYVHPNLGYGTQAAGSISPNSLLIFEIEMYAIN